jgi:hypothetical protein
VAALACGNQLGRLEAFAEVAAFLRGTQPAAEDDHDA